MSRTQVCECGHVYGMHTARSCRACACNRYAPASPAQAVILATISQQGRP